MTTNWLLNDSGDPLGAFRRLLAGLWHRSGLDGFLAPPTDPIVDHTPRLLRDTSQLEAVNPFRPVMADNIARHLPYVQQANPGARLGVLVRPCEMRALTEMARHDVCGLGNVLTVCVDCLATLPDVDYALLATQRQNGARMTDEVVRFARLGGISPYRFRSACQMCASFTADEGDVNVGVIGLEARQHLLVSTQDLVTAQRLELEWICDRAAPDAVMSERARVVAQLTERHYRARERVEHCAADRLPEAAEDVAARLNQCAPCRACLDACPICATLPLGQSQNGTWTASDVRRWLSACTGCGMCEQACPNHLPLSAMLGHVRSRLSPRHEWVVTSVVREAAPV